MNLDDVVPALKDRDMDITEGMLVGFLDGYISWKDFLTKLGVSHLKKYINTKEELVKALSHALVRMSDLRSIVCMYKTYGNTSYANFKMDKREQLTKIIEQTQRMAAYHILENLKTVDAKAAPGMLSDACLLLRYSLPGDNQKNQKAIE